jgi:dihydroorotase
VLESDYHSHTKMNPPLRPQDHVDALRSALADGTIQAIATDHAPHADIEKDCEFACAAFGVTGLETSLALTLRLVAEGVIERMRAIELLTIGPLSVIGLSDRGRIAAGQRADLCVIDPAVEWVVDPEAGFSKSMNTPFAGWKLTGRPEATVFGGTVVFAGGQTAR